MTLRKPRALATPSAGTIRAQHGVKRLDLASLALLLMGVVSIGMCVAAIQVEGATPLVLLPALIAAVTGALHLFKREIH